MFSHCCASQCTLEVNASGEGLWLAFPIFESFTKMRKKILGKCGVLLFPQRWFHIHLLGSQCIAEFQHYRSRKDEEWCKGPKLHADLSQQRACSPSLTCFLSVQQHQGFGWSVCGGAVYIPQYTLIVKAISCILWSVKLWEMQQNVPESLVLRLWQFCNWSLIKSISMQSFWWKVYRSSLRHGSMQNAKSFSTHYLGSIGMFGLLLVGVIVGT